MSTQVSSSKAPPSKAYSANTARQPRLTSSTPPSMGPSMGATAIAEPMRLSLAADSTAECWSRMAALDTTVPATITACSTLHPSSTVTFGASMQPNDAPMKSSKAPSITGRRPKWSETGPRLSWNSAEASM